MTYKKIGIIGFGSWVKNAYLPVLSEIENLNISHVSTKTEKSLVTAKTLINNTDCKFSLDYMRLIDDKQLDLIIISVPDSSHGKIISDVLSRDIDCIFEMPLSMENSESKKIISKMSHKSNIYIPNLEMSHLPIISYLGKMFETNKFGNLEKAKLKLSANWWPGFSIYTASPWYIDVFNKIFKIAPKRVTSSGVTKSKFPTESKGSAILDYGDFFAEWEFDMETQTELSVILDLYFEKETVQVDLMKSEIKSDNNKKISFFEPHYGWPGMKEFILNTMFEKQDRLQHIEDINILQNISNGLKLSVNTKDWHGV